MPSQIFWLTPVFLNRQKLNHYLVSFHWQNWLWVVFIHIHCSVFKDQSAFSAAKIILSNLLSFVKHFFHFFIFVLFTDISHQQKLLYQVRIRLSMFLFKNFSAFCDFCDSIFSACPPFSREHLYIIHAWRKMSTPFFTFFHFLFKPLIFPHFHRFHPLFRPCFFYIMQQNPQKQNPNGMPSGF